MSDLAFTLSELHVHPIKSCAGLAVDEAVVIDTGLEWDREWVVVDERGRFVSQREVPRMALIHTAMRLGELKLRAPGMLALHLSLDAVETPCRVQVWNDTVAAFDMGDTAAQWFSDFLGRQVRLARFDPDTERPCSPKWTGGAPAFTAFADAYPLLVVTRAALDGLNHRLAAQGAAAVDWRRFRPNLVLDGLDAHAEDFIDELSFATDDGPVRLRLVKPCTRCPIPDIDPDSAVPGHAVGDAMQTYRGDARLDGAITFGMNAIVLEGLGRTLRRGQRGEATIKF